MTGGTVVSLGEVGVNFGAGMSGGMAFVFDENRTFSDKLNSEMVEALRIDTEVMEGYRLYLKDLIKEYAEKTQDSHAKAILADFSRYIHNFWLVKSRAISVDQVLELFANNHDAA
jgi:glutamate synthase (NADPH/NADH) large chain